MTDWKIFNGSGAPHNGLQGLPRPPPWRFSRIAPELAAPASDQLSAAEEERRAAPFLTSEPMKLAVNAALYLRRPLLLTGPPGTGKSTLIAKVAHELRLGPVLRWPINSRSTVRGGVYEYDAVGRLQAGRDVEPPVEEYLTLGPLGTALKAETWPRALLIDEIDKSDLDFANDLLNLIEEGEYDIPELRRLKRKKVEVLDFNGTKVPVENGRIVCGPFPFVVMTSNAEREFPGPFLRRCVRLTIESPTPTQMEAIVESQLRRYAAQMNRNDIDALIKRFDESRKQKKDISTDQLLNAIFLTVAVRDGEGRTFSESELADMRTSLMQPLSLGG
jgi:MoxR-like ATPase